MTNNWLIKTEIELRGLLAEVNTRSRRDRDFKILLSKDYIENYKKWAYLREKGVQRGIFLFFVPSSNDKKLT